MKSVIKKAKKQLEQLEEKFTVMPSIVKNSSDKKAKVVVKVDASDEGNSDTYRENSNIFTQFNNHSSMASIRVDVKIDEDIEEDSSDAIAEGGEETVYGNGSNPKPEDETYLNLLKGVTSTKKIKISVKD